MVGRLFTFSSALSLLLCAGTIVMWVRSNHVGDSFGYGFGKREVRLNSWGRIVGIGVQTLPPNSAKQGFFYEERTSLNSAAPASSFFSLFYPVPSTVPLALRSRFGRHSGGSVHFGAVGEPFVYESNFTEWFAPWWVVCAAAAILPSVSCGRFALKTCSSRWRAGHCRKCGYDLRATPERSPECGTIPAAKVKA